MFEVEAAMEIIDDASGVCCDVDLRFQLVFAVYIYSSSSSSSSVFNSRIYMLSLSFTFTKDNCNELYTVNCELQLQADSQSLLKFK